MHRHSTPTGPKLQARKYLLTTSTTRATVRVQQPRLERKGDEKMRKVTTSNGHEWVLPETVGEFQNAGVNLDDLCRMAGCYVVHFMNSRSNSAIKHGTPFIADINNRKRYRTPAQIAREKAQREQERLAKKTSKITKKLTPELRAALLAELTKEPTNG